MAYLDCIRLCNNAQLADYMVWRIDGSIYGWLSPHFARHLLAYPAVFQQQNHELQFQAELTTPEQRSLATEQVMRALHDQGVIDTGSGSAIP